MLTIVLSVIVFAILVAGMAVGVIFANKPIAGSCGGLNTLGMKENCEICGGDDIVCEEEALKRAKVKKQDVLSVGGTVQTLFNDATQNKKTEK